jgi:hypothetical protein
MRGTHAERPFSRPGSLTTTQRPIYVHIGFRKTATTTLQQELFSRHPLIRYLGRPYEQELVTKDGKNLDQLLRKTMSALHSHVGTFDVDMAKRCIGDVRAAIANDRRPWVLSDECLSMGSRSDRSSVAEGLRNLFGNCHIFATIRSQFSSVPSWYFWQVRKGRTDLDFEPWLEAQVKDRTWKVEQYRYGAAFDLYRRLFPDARIAFVPYELLSEDKRAFALELANWLGIDPSVTVDVLSAAKPLNAVGSLEKARAMRTYDRIGSAYAKLHKRWFPGFALSRSLPAIWEAKETARHRIFRSLGGRYAGAFILTKPAWTMLMEYYAKDNARLCGLAGCDLSKFAYPLP